MNSFFFFCCLIQTKHERKKKKSKVSPLSVFIRKTVAAKYSDRLSLSIHTLYIFYNEEHGVAEGGAQLCGVESCDGCDAEPSIGTRTLISF
jgi:hypothetical protein